jgi:N12 class adenine-specific DNA methylase
MNTNEPGKESYPYLLSSSHQRVWSNNPYFNFFSATDTIQNPTDVAQIFNTLQSEGIEHLFCLHVKKDKSFYVQWISSGNTNQALADIQQIISGALHFKAETVYLIHNHPSGSLRASDSDINLTRKIKEQLKQFNVNTEHIIINLNSGKFALLGENANETQQLDLPQTDSLLKPLLTVHTFSRHVFQQKYYPELIQSKSDVAAIISSYRFSTEPIMGMLIINSSACMVANYLIYPVIGTPKENCHEIVPIASLHGNNRIILYGNLPINRQLHNYFHELQTELSDFNIELIDYIQYSEEENLLQTSEAGYSYQGIHQFSPLELSDYNTPSQILDEPTETFYKNDFISNFNKLENSIDSLQNVLEGQPITPIIEKELANFPGTGFAWSYILNHEFPEAWKPYEIKYQEAIKTIYTKLEKLTIPGSQKSTILNSIKSAAATSFFTPQSITDTVIKAIQPLIKEKARVLEPSAGSGNFVKSISKNISFESITAIEKDILTSLILEKRFSLPNLVTYNIGYESFLNSANQKFDLIVSNIPFGDFSVYDKQMNSSKIPVIKAATRRIHNFYFVKSVDLLNDKGVLAFITTNGFTNAYQNKNFRQYLVSKADLVCNVALPNTLFNSSNTSVGTNLLVFKRNFNKQFTTSFEEAFIENNHSLFFPAGDEKNIIATSATLQKNQYGSLAPFYDFKGGELQLNQLLGSIIEKQIDTYNAQTIISETKDAANSYSSSLQLSLFDIGTTKQNNVVLTEKSEAGSIEKTEKFIVDKLDFYKNGWLVTNGNNIGTWQYEHENLPEYSIEPMLISKQSNHTKLVQLLLLRDSFLKLYYSECNNSDFNNETERIRVNKLYDSFRSITRAPIGHRDNKEALALTNQTSFFKNLERLTNEGHYQKVSLFDKPIFLKEKPTNLTPFDALAYSLNINSKVDLEVMSNITGSNHTELIEVLKGHIFYESVIGEWQEKSVFLAGNINLKIKACADFLKKASPDNEFSSYVNESLASLKNVLPIPIPFEDISIQLGNSWLPTEYYTLFARELFQEPTLNIHFLQSSNEFSVTPRMVSNSIINTTFALSTEFRNYTGIQLLEMAMNDDLPNITKTISHIDGSTSKITDTENLLVLKQKLEIIHEKFYQFIYKLPKGDKDSIALLYNNLYNSELNFKANGNHLTLDDLHFFKETVYPYQKNAIWHIIINKGGIIDLPPGAGKSLVMFVAAHEMKKMRLCNKPLIICLKANIEQMVTMHKLAYPNDQILYPNEKDFTTKNRDNILYQIANNNWDCVFLTHEQFAEITPSPPIEKQIIEQELNMVRNDLAVLTNNNPTKRQLKGLQKKQENLEGRLKATLNNISRKAELFTYDKLGIDKIFVDESQFFKNLTFSTRHQQISGIGNPEGSQRAFNLLIALRTNQSRLNSDFGATFLTGTTISNSIAEMYLLFKYMIPEKLEQMRISNFDAWSKVFAVKSSEYEFSVTTEFKLKTRFRTFNNVPELSSIYNSVAYFIHPSQLELKKPIEELKQIIITQTPEQTEFTNRLIQFAKNPDPAILGMTHRFSKEQSKTAKMLICTDLGKKMTLDMRMIDPHAEDHPGSKLSQCAAEISKRYKNFNNQKGTQLVFLDTGTPGGDGFNAYAELKRKLVNDYFIPSSHVAFIHDATTSIKKETLLDSFRRGEIRVLIGSTRKLGTGINAQDNVIAMHSLDVPWNPAGMEQRGGRGARQGNILAPLLCNNKVEHLLYTTEKSLDIFRFQVLATKQAFIDTIKQNNINLRTIDETTFDENSSMSYGQFIATLTGNPLLLENQRIVSTISQLEAQKKAFYNEQYRIRSKYETLCNDLELNKKWVSLLEADKLFLEKHPVPEIDKKKIYSFLLQGKVYSDTEAFGKELKILKESGKLSSIIQQTIGQFRGFDIVSRSNSVFLTRPDIQHSFKYDFNFENNDNYNCGRYPIHCLQRIEPLLQKYVTLIEQNTRDLSLLEVKETLLPWPKEEQLSSLKNRKIEIEREIESAEIKTVPSISNTKLSNSPDTNEIIQIKKR